MGDSDALANIQASLQLLLDQNEKFGAEIAELKKENAQLKKQTEDKEERIAANKTKWKEALSDCSQLMYVLEEFKEKLVKDSVGSDFFDEGNELNNLSYGFTKLLGRTTTIQPIEKANEEPAHLNPAERFSGIAKEERLDCFFGEEGNSSSVAMRRFCDRYQTIKKMNMGLKISGWDDPKYRAGKITLCLKGDAFDYVQFANSMDEPWTNDDKLLLGKLQDKFINIQAIEMNILHFEQSVQETRESIDEFMSRLRRSVRDAYDGDNQHDLDRKVAWRFVSGLRDKICRDKILDAGWMLNRKEAKPLDELQKMAEYARRNEDASRAIGKTAPGSSIAAFESEEATISPFVKDRSSFGSRSTTPSSESRSSVDSRRSGKSMPGQSQEFLECFYCKKKHKGGWAKCDKRLSEDPGWRPSKGDGKRPYGRKDFR